MGIDFGRWKVSFFRHNLHSFSHRYSLWLYYYCLEERLKQFLMCHYPLTSSFFAKTASASLRFRNLTIVRSVLPSLWHATVSFLSILTLILLKTQHKAFQIFIVNGTGNAMSKHSLLELYSSLYCYLSKLTSFSLVFWNASCKIFDVFCATATCFIILRSV